LVLPLAGRSAARLALRWDNKSTAHYSRLPRVKEAG
jgi:hypothetical protein